MIYVMKEDHFVDGKKRDVEQLQDKQFVCSMSLSEFDELKESLQLPPGVEQMAKRIETRFRSGMQQTGEILYGAISTLDVLHMNDSKGQVMIAIHPRYVLLIFSVDKDRKGQCRFEETMDMHRSPASLGNVLCGFLEHYLEHGNEALEHMGKQIEEVEEELANNRLEHRMNKELYLMKKCTCIWIHFYEQMVDVTERCEKWCKKVNERIGENSQEIQKSYDEEQLTQLNEKAQRLLDETKDLKESLVQLREELDATLEYDLNRLMTTFTEVTTICLPLNLIAGWYGMNFEHMPEIGWKYGYAFAWALGIGVVSFVILFFRKKKLF